MLKPTGTYGKVAKFLHLLDEAGIKHKNNVKIDWSDNMIKISLSGLSMLGSILNILSHNFAEMIDYIMRVEYTSGINPFDIVIVFKDCIVKHTNVSNKEHQMLNVEINGGEGIIEVRKGDMCEFKVVKLNKNGKRRKKHARKIQKRK